MRSHLLFVSLTLALTVNAKTDQCQTLVPVIDPHGQPRCCESGHTHNGIACVPCDNPGQYYDSKENKCKDPEPCSDPNKVFFWSLGRCASRDRCRPWGYYNGRDCEPNPTCPPGFRWGDNGCMIIPCRDGEVWLNNHCEEKTSCDARNNEYYDPNTNGCLVCAPHEYPGASGCRPKPSYSDPEYYHGPGRGCAPCDMPGTYWNGRKCVPEPDCNTGYHREGGKCVKNDCKLGQYWDIPKRVLCG